jgi:uncharacterized protein YceH (UPF0502 family)
VRFLGKRPGERVGRWTDLLGAPADPDSPSVDPDDAARAAESEPLAPATSDLLSRVEALEREVARLRSLLE